MMGNAESKFAIMLPPTIILIACVKNSMLNVFRGAMEDVKTSLRAAKTSKHRILVYFKINAFGQGLIVKLWNAVMLQTIFRILSASLFYLTSSA